MHNYSEFIGMPLHQYLVDGSEEMTLYYIVRWDSTGGFKYVKAHRISYGVDRSRVERDDDD
jgi:hypothetical protein